MIDTSSLSITLQEQASTELSPSLVYEYGFHEDPNKFYRRQMEVFISPLTTLALILILP